MKKSLLALSVSLLTASAWAQTAAPSVAPTQAPLGTQVRVLSNGTPVMPGASSALPPLPTGANPFTGVTKAQSEIERSEEELKRLRQISNQKLALQRDELEALKIELDKKKVWDQLNPPKPVIIPVEAPKAGAPASGSSAPTNTSAKTASSTPSKVTTAKTKVSSAPVVAKVEPKPATPPQVIAPAPSKFETPQVVGIMDMGGQRIAMVKHDGQTLQATTGSILAGKSISAIANNGIQWGGSFLKVSHSDGAVPGFVQTDTGRGSNTVPVVSAPVPAPQPTYNQSSYNPPVNGALSPQGATRTTGGASGPTGVLQLPPPPPSMNQNR